MQDIISFERCPSIKNIVSYDYIIIFTQVINIHDVILPYRNKIKLNGIE